MSRSHPGRRPSRSATIRPTPMSQVAATLLLACVWAISWGIICGILLSVFGKLPPPVAAIASSIQAVILFLVAVFGAVGKTAKNFFGNVWKSARRRLSALLGIVVASSIAIAIGFSSQSGGNGNTIPT